MIIACRGPGRLEFASHENLFQNRYAQDVDPEMHWFHPVHYSTDTVFGQRLSR